MLLDDASSHVVSFAKVGKSCGKLVSHVAQF
jgi:hypothetical protein